MSTKTYLYPVTIQESYLDVFGHVNNAMYLTLFEEARWDIIHKNGYGLKKILETGIGPVILEIHLKFSKELRLRDEIVIETELLSHTKKVAEMGQKMIRNGDVCCTAQFTIGLFSLKERKLIHPTEEWLKAIGIIASESDSSY